MRDSCPVQGDRAAAERPAAALDSLSIDGERISARLRLGGEEHELVYQVPDVPVEPRYEPFLVAALPLAMSAALSLSVPEPVSPRLLGSIPTIQQILAAWSEPLLRPGYGPLLPVDLDASPGVPEADTARGTASFFSSGVDSFYTTLRNRDALEGLVYVHGFDVSLANRRTHDALLRSLRASAGELGLPLIVIETSLRETSDRFVGDIRLYQGAFVVSAAHRLAARFERVLYPAPYSYEHLDPHGLHPLLDPMWSTEAVEIVHEGVVPRTEKIAELSTSDVAMGRVRVCWDEYAPGNCGRCDKCLRTIAALRVLGALERCEAMPDRDHLPALPRAWIGNETSPPDWRELLAEAEADGTDPELIRALRRAVRRGRVYAALRGRGSSRYGRLWRAVGRVERRLPERRRVRRAQ